MLHHMDCTLLQSSVGQDGILRSVGYRLFFRAPGDWRRLTTFALLTKAPHIPELCCSRCSTQFTRCERPSAADLLLPQSVDRVDPRGSLSGNKRG
jgi:hypothetical protein